MVYIQPEITIYFTNRGLFSCNKIDSFAGRLQSPTVFSSSVVPSQISPSTTYPPIEVEVAEPKVLVKMTETDGKSAPAVSFDCPFGKLPDHLLIEIFLRVPMSDWGQISCVKKQWAKLFQEECLWYAALIRSFPLAGQAKRWPGPITRGSSKRRYAALYASKNIFSLHDEIDEIVGHTYLFLKEQLECSMMPLPSGILHGTIIDQFIACGKSQAKAYELASLIWLAVIDNLEETEKTFSLLKRLVMEGDVFLPFPYSRSYKVQWRLFERLFTDFRDCFNQVDYYDLLSFAKNKFQPIPSAWLGY